jgi:O-antigen/teichoic acid export membrane protein
VTQPDQSPDIQPADSLQQPRVSVLGGAVVTGAAMLVRLASNFAIAILVARALGPVGKGQLTLVQQYTGVAALIVGLGFEGAHSYFVGRRKRPAEQAVSDTLLFVTAMSVVGVPALWLVLSRWVPALADVPDLTLLLAAFALVPALLTSLISGVLVGQGKVRSQAIATISGTLTTVGLAAAWALVGDLTLTRVIAATVTGLVVGAVVATASTRIRRLPRPSIARMREEVSYAWKSYVQNVAGYLELRQDILLLGILASASAVGVYSVGVSLAELIFFVPQALVVALTARALQEEMEAGVRLTTSITRLLMAFTVVSTIVLGVIVRPLIGLAFGPGFEQAAIIYALLVPGILSWALCSQAQAFLATHGRLFPGLGTSAVLVNLALNLFLIPRYGIYGAAVATSVSYIFGNGYVIWVFLRETNTGLGELLWLRRTDVEMLAAAARARMGRLE